MVDNLPTTIAPGFANCGTACDPAPKFKDLGPVELLAKVMRALELLKEEDRLLHVRTAELEAKLQKYENPKDSGSSSMPPSRDPFRKTKSLRGGKRSPGGQKGHKSKKPEMAARPDEDVLHDVHECSRCGGAPAAGGRGP